MKTPKSLYSRLALATSVTLVVGYFVVYAAWSSLTVDEVGSGATITTGLMTKIKDNFEDLNTRVSNFSFSGGNVGIGTSTPGQKLSVVGTVESTSGGFKFPNGKTQAIAFDFAQCRKLSGSVLMKDGETGCDRANYGSCSKVFSCTAGTEYLVSYSLGHSVPYFLGATPPTAASPLPINIDSYYGVRSGDNTVQINVGSFDYWNNSANCATYPTWGCGAVMIDYICCPK